MGEYGKYGRVVGSKPQFTIRKGGRGDIEALAYLFRDLQKFHQVQDPRDFALVDDLSVYEGVLNWNLDMRDGQFLIAETRGEIIGYTLLQIWQRDKIPLLTDALICTVHHIFVAEEYRRQGVMKALIAGIEEIARDAEVDFIDVGVRGFNDVSRGAFEKAGFELHKTVSRKIL